MIEQRICDPESIERQRKLMLAFEASAQAWESRRIAAQTDGETALQARATVQRDIALSVCKAIRKRIESAALFSASNDDTASWLPPTFAAPPVETEGQAVCWMREHYPEVWYRRAYAELAAVAKWWLFIRAAVRARLWLP